jgi:hypothetical protein
MQTWRDAVRTLNITEPMIEDRQEVGQTAPGAKGWYY